MKIFDNWFTPKPLTPAQRLRKGEQVSIEEICDYLRDTLPKDEQDKFFAEIQLSVYPVFVQKLLEFKEKGELSEADFFQHLKDQTSKINLLLDQQRETKIS